MFNLSVDIILLINRKNFGKGYVDSIAQKVAKAVVYDEKYLNNSLGQLK